MGGGDQPEFLQETRYQNMCQKKKHGAVLEHVIKIYIDLYTLMVQSCWTDGSGQRVQTMICLLLLTYLILSLIAIR